MKVNDIDNLLQTSAIMKRTIAENAKYIISIEKNCAIYRDLLSSMLVIAKRNSRQTDWYTVIDRIEKVLKEARK